MSSSAWASPKLILIFLPWWMKQATVTAAGSPYYLLFKLLLLSQ
jgi:hypothetical protein